MNIYLKNIFVSFVIFIFSGCVNSSDNSISKKTLETNDRESLCYKANYGKFSLDSVNTDDSSFNSFLLSCSASVVVPMLDDSPDIAKQRKQRKVKLANALLALELDVNYVDESKTSLLMTVVMSYMPKEWKTKQSSI